MVPSFSSYVLCCPVRSHANEVRRTIRPCLHQSKVKTHCSTNSCSPNGQIFSSSSVVRRGVLPNTPTNRHAQIALQCADLLNASVMLHPRARLGFGDSKLLCSDISSRLAATLIRVGLTITLRSRRWLCGTHLNMSVLYRQGDRLWSESEAFSKKMCAF